MCWCECRCAGVSACVLVERRCAGVSVSVLVLVWTCWCECGHVGVSVCVCTGVSVLV